MLKGFQQGLGTNRNEDKSGMDIGLDTFRLIKLPKIKHELFCGMSDIAIIGIPSLPTDFLPQRFGFSHNFLPLLSWVPVTTAALMPKELLSKIYSDLSIIIPKPTIANVLNNLDFQLEIFSNHDLKLSHVYM